MDLESTHIPRLVLDAATYRGEERTRTKVFFDGLEGPCVGCVHRQRCADELLVCKQFRMFIHTPSQVDYESERIPTRAGFDKVFGDDDEDERGAWER